MDVHTVNVSKDGVHIKMGGMGWDPEMDVVEVPIPSVHFSQHCRRRLDDATIFFKGGFEDLERFVPATLSRRQIASKLASIFDLTGKLAPVIMGLKADRREVILATESWDDAVPQNLCGKWVKNLWKLEQLRGMKFHQPIIPGNAINCVLRPITAVDASLDAMIMGCWVCFECPMVDGHVS